MTVHAHPGSIFYRFFLVDKNHFSCFLMLGIQTTVFCSHKSCTSESEFLWLNCAYETFWNKKRPKATDSRSVVVGLVLQAQKALLSASKRRTPVREIGYLWISQLGFESLSPSLAQRLTGYKHRLLMCYCTAGRPRSSSGWRGPPPLFFDKLSGHFLVEAIAVFLSVGP